MPSNIITKQIPLSKTQKDKIFPATPTLLGVLNIDTKLYNIKRNELLKKKTETVIYDKRLRDYQNQDVHFLIQMKQKAIFNEQRTGKTPTTLVTMRILQENLNIIIAPGSTLYSWKKEYDKWHKGNAIIYEGTKAKRKKLLENFSGTLIMTYGIALNDKDILLKRKFDAIVVDEAHRLRNFKGMRSKHSPAFAKAIMELSKNIKGRYALTGTPAPNYPYNIFGIYHFLMPKLFKSYWQFIDYYFDVKDVVINRQLDTIKEIGGYLNQIKEQEAVEFLEQKEVMLWLPEIDIQKISIDATKTQLKALEEMHEFYEYKDIEAMNDLDRMTKERQIANDPRIVGLKTKGAKTLWLEQLLKDYPDKTFIFASESTSWLKILDKELKNSKLLIGGLNNKQKNIIETDFNNGKYQILLCNIQVAMEGMKLWRADKLIFLSRDLTQSYNTQMGDRLVPITEAIALEKPHQEIIILKTNTDIEDYIDLMLNNKFSKSEIINNYKNYKRK